MIDFNELLEQLGYSKSPYYQLTSEPSEPEIAHLFRAANDAGVTGVYVVKADPDLEHKLLSSRPVVFVAEADSETAAHQIHRSVWNLSYAPFLIVKIPSQILIYTGFSYSTRSNSVGLLDRVEHLTQLRDILAVFNSDSIDSGNIWASQYSAKLDTSNRVDKQLLKSLNQLGDLLKKNSLDDQTAHSLIGKYVYIRYLWDREILTSEWLREQNISPESIFSREATVAELSKLIDALENRFNGKIFPIEFTRASALSDQHVAWTASVFMGDQILSGALGTIHQLHLDFQAYQFEYIPIETLSAVYEQFIEGKREKGAIYTPELLADYLLSEVEAVKRLDTHTKILDPSCGSGIFLVLAYRRLIETELAKRPDDKLSPEELKNLLKNIYGVERELDACYVTEFSLILSLLHYIQPRELHKNPEFRFPELHNINIFHADFFDNSSRFWELGLKFDWIVGNPPWVKAEKGKGQEYAEEWIKRNVNICPVGDKGVAEAFTWKVSTLLSQSGVAGLVMPATSLVNVNSDKYRQSFFSHFDVVRVTNFANLREVLFDKRSALPAATIIYKFPKPGQRKSDIVHYGPLVVDQLTDISNKPWAITINENEISIIPSSEAENGETSTWKLALWGTHRDKRAIERLRRLFPTTLEQFCDQQGWGNHLPRQGAEFCEDATKPKAQIRNKRRFDTLTFSQMRNKYRFSMPEHILKTVTEDAYIRRGEDTLNVTTPAPHIIISKGWDFFIYSDEDFIIPPQQMGIAAPKESSDVLRALTVYLSSSLVRYYLFFQVPEWGFFRHRESVVVTEVRKIPVPNFTYTQIQELALFHHELVQQEMQAFSQVFVDPFLQATMQVTLDNMIFETFDIPMDIVTLVNDFVTVRLALDEGQGAIGRITRYPEHEELRGYADELAKSLNNFVMGTIHHDVTINKSRELIECIVELKDESSSHESIITINDSDLVADRLLKEIRDSIGYQFSQWVYVQRGIRLFDGPRIFIYKQPRLMNWTRTQALNDASDVIRQIIAAGMSSV